MARSDPGPCPICGEAHAACTSASGPVTIAQLPARDATAVAPTLTVTLAEAVQATLPPGQFTTGTYRGQQKKR